MTRRRVLLIIVAALAGASLMLGLYDPDIDAPTATAMAERMARHYRAGAGEPPNAFGPREGRQWADGWEFRWRYKSCPELASLRVWISRNGRRAAYAELPDCEPTEGFGVPAAIA